MALVMAPEKHFLFPAVLQMLGLLHLELGRQRLSREPWKCRVCQVHCLLSLSGQLWDPCDGCWTAKQLHSSTSQSGATPKNFQGVSRWLLESPLPILSPHCLIIAKN